MTPNRKPANDISLEKVHTHNIVVSECVFYVALG